MTAIDDPRPPLSALGQSMTMPRNDDRYRGMTHLDDPRPPLSAFGQSMSAFPGRLGRSAMNAVRDPASAFLDAGDWTVPGVTEAVRAGDWNSLPREMFTAAAMWTLGGGAAGKTVLSELFRLGKKGLSHAPGALTALAASSGDAQANPVENALVSLSKAFKRAPSSYTPYYMTKAEKSDLTVLKSMSLPRAAQDAIWTARFEDGVPLDDLLRAYLEELQ